MYAQLDSTTLSSRSSARLTASRATLRSRPLIQRALIRSWEYIKPVRVALLAFRLEKVQSLANLLGDDVQAAVEIDKDTLRPELQAHFLTRDRFAGALQQDDKSLKGLFR